jgi:hypothetical protein
VRGGGTGFRQIPGVGPPRCGLRCLGHCQGGWWQLQQRAKSKPPLSSPPPWEHYTGLVGLLRFGNTLISMSWQAVHSQWGMGSGGGLSPCTATLGCGFLLGVLGNQVFDTPVGALQPRSAEDPERLFPPDSAMSLDWESSFQSSCSPALASALVTSHQACGQLPKGSPPSLWAAQST